jgi:hypothetical protein
VSGENVLNIRVFPNPKEAPIFRPPEFLAAKIDHANVVRQGTTEGKSTVDLVFQDEKGQKYVVLITGRLIRSLAHMVGDEG